MLTVSMVCVDPPAIRNLWGLLMGKASDVASKRLRVLHIRPNLLENGPSWTHRRNNSLGRKRGSMHVVLF